LTSNPQDRNGTIESYGLKTEVLYASKLGCAEIIPTVEQKNFWEDEMARSLVARRALIKNPKRTDPDPQKSAKVACQAPRAQKSSPKNP